MMTWAFKLLKLDPQHHDASGRYSICPFVSKISWEFGLRVAGAVLARGWGPSPTLGADSSAAGTRRTLKDARSLKDPEWKGPLSAG